MAYSKACVFWYDATNLFFLGFRLPIFVMKFLFLQQCKSISTKVEFCWEVEQRVMWKIVDLTFLWALNFLGCQTTLVFVRTLPRIDSTSGTSTTSHLRKSAKYHLLQENIYQFEKWKRAFFAIIILWFF